MRTTLTVWAVLGLLCLPAAARGQTPAGGTGVPPVSDSGSLGLRPVPGATGVATDGVEGGAPQRDGRDARTTHTLDLPNYEDIPYFIESGLLDNPSDEYAVVFSHEVHLPGAAWLRLFYDKAVLAGDSRVRVTSLLDGDVQELNAAILAQWSNASAYFNGERVLLELVAGPRTRGNELNLGHVRKQARRQHNDDTQTTNLCGTDDRVPSTEEWSGRTFDGGCTATIFTSESWMISAGYCDEPNEVLQFHVPPSVLYRRSCEPTNPPAEHQFPILPGGMSETNGLGDDWWVAEVGQNGDGLKPFQKYGQLRRVAPTPANAGDASALYAYGGQALNCPNHFTQQLSPGNISARMPTYYVYNNDTTGGCQGAGLVVNDLVVGVVTMASVNCVNPATRVDNPDFAAARRLAIDCLTDLNGDGFTSQADLARLLAAYDTLTGDSEFDPVADLDSDGAVGQSDLAALLAAYGTGCP